MEAPRRHPRRAGVAVSAIPFHAEPFRYVRAWCCYQMVMALPPRWMSLRLLPYAGDWAYRYATDGDTDHLQEDCNDR